MSAAPASAIPQDHIRRLVAASELLSQGRREEAVSLLRALTREAPRLAQAQRLLGVALGETGDLLEAESAFRAALAADPSLMQAAVGLAETLRNLDRGTEAIALLAPLVTPQTTDLGLLTYFGFALQSVGRFDEATRWLTQAARANPTSVAAEHNVASALGDLSRHEDSETAARRAFARGGDAAETWLVLARALDAQDRWEEADAAYAEALGRRPGYPDALGDLAKRVWMRTGELAAAEAVLDKAMVATGADPNLLAHKAKLREVAGDPAAAAELLDEALRLTADPLLHVARSQIAVRLDPDLALDHAQRAFAARPDNYAVIVTLAQARLALGFAAEAASLAEILTERQPWDQYAAAVLATCWRLLGDPRYDALYDYDLFVRGFELSAPPGWSSLKSWLGDLEAELAPLHPFRGHPVGQSVRYGSQTRGDLKHAQTPAIRAFLKALDAPIRAYMAEIGPGEDLLRRRITGAYRFDGVWSVKLRPGGFHADHVHHRGWISSACHIRLPAAVSRTPEGWLKFGEPGIPTKPQLPAEHWEEPQEGRLVLFPAYMWHGTAPFGGEESRLSIAFDVIPA